MAEVEAEADFVVTSVKLKGLPVSQGVVKGTARVVTSLSDASAIQVRQRFFYYFSQLLHLLSQGLMKDCGRLLFLQLLLHLSYFCLGLLFLSVILILLHSLNTSKTASLYIFLHFWCVSSRVTS